MAFFDELNRRITSTTNKVGQMAGDASEIARLKVQIGSANDKLRKLYVELGKAYHASRPENASPELSDLINEIDATLLAVKDAEEKVNAHKTNLSTTSAPAASMPVDGTVCPVCGNIVSRNAKFCTSCGNPIEHSKITYCTNCGNPIEQGAKFCTVCGTVAPTPGNEPFDELAVDFELTENGVLQFDTVTETSSESVQIDDPVKIDLSLESQDISEEITDNESYSEE